MPHLSLSTIRSLACLVGWVWVSIVPASAEPFEPIEPADPLSTLIEERGWAPLLPPQGVDESPSRADVVVHAIGFVGVPYRRGGESAEHGFDCSGFVQVAFQQSLGVSLPRSAAEQAHATSVINRSDLLPGDLVFFNTLGSRFSHVGIYVGEGRFIHSPRSGARVRLESMQTTYWNRRFTGARRVVVDEAQTTAFVTQ